MNTKTNTSLQEYQDRITEAKKAIRECEAGIHQLTYVPTDPAAVKELRKQQKLQKYKTSNGLTVHKLRLAGYEVKVTHIRFTDVHTPKLNHKGELIGELVLTVPVNAYLHKVYDFNARGGVTHIVITNPDKTRWVAVQAICHEIDSYDYKLGVKTALENIDPTVAAQMREVIAEFFKKTAVLA